MTGADVLQKITHLSNPLLLLLACILTLPVYSQSDYVDCDDYEVPELKKMCSGGDYDSPDQYVYDDVSETGLNELAESWDSGYSQQLRIIPPGRYILSRPLILSSYNSLVPDPTIPLNNKTLRTIELVASDDFQQADDGFYLVRLEGFSQAGGLEIHGADQPGTLLDSFHGRNISNPRYCLVRAASLSRTGFVASVLTGYQTLDGLFCNTSSRPHNWSDGLILQRNYLRTYGARGAIAMSANYSGGSLLIENNSIFIDPLPQNQAGEISSGLYLGKLSSDWQEHEYDWVIPASPIRHNDFIFPVNSGDSTATRRGIEIGDATDFLLELNAFITPLAQQPGTHDIAIFDTRAKVHGHRIMDLTGNSFSPYLIPGGANHHKGSGETMNVITDGSKQYSFSTPYPLEQPEAFMKYRGNLGNSPVLTSLLQSVNLSGNLSPIPEESYPRNFTTISEYLGREASSCPECLVDYPQPFRSGDFSYIPIVVIAVVNIALSVGCGNFARRRAMGKSGCGCR